MYILYCLVVRVSIDIAIDIYQYRDIAKYILYCLVVNF